MCVKNEWLLLVRGAMVILGLNALWGQSERLQRTLVGGHVKIGLGSWFFQSQWDLNERQLRSNAQRFDQVTGFVRAEWRLSDWIIPHLTREWLSVEVPFERRRIGVGAGARMRLSESISLSGDYKEVKQGRRVDQSFLTQMIVNFF